MSRDNIEESVKNAKQLELAGLEAELQDKEKQNVALKNKDAYKMVMFFETKKVTRRISQLKKQLASMIITMGKPPSAEEASIRTELADKEEELMYINKYPLEEKYISILKTPTDETVAEKRNGIIQKIHGDNGYVRPTFRMSVDGTDNGTKSTGHFLSSDEESESEEESEEESD